MHFNNVSDHAVDKRDINFPRNKTFSWKYFLKLNYLRNGKLIRC